MTGNEIPDMETQSYKNYRIDFWAKPGPCRAMDWGFAHEDFDGAPDSGDTRFGYARTLEEAMEEIDEQIEAELPLVAVAYLHGSKEETADKLYELGFERDTEEFEKAFEQVNEALYEVKFHINISNGKILAVNDKFLGGEYSEEG